MLLVSSITPSGKAWALEAVERSVPGARVLDVSRIDVPTYEPPMGVPGAGASSAEMLWGLRSLRDISALSAAYEQSVLSTDITVVWFGGSVASAVTDLLALVSLMDIAGSSSEAGPVRMLRSAATAITSGEVELLLACPPEESAIHATKVEVATASACGIRIRGVAVCPMPSKSDGWSKSARVAARAQFDHLDQALHPITVGRARRGIAPSFPAPGQDVCAPTVTAHSGEWVWSISIPGSSAADLSVGTWSADPAYPSTHVVVGIDGRTIRFPLDPIVRRCTAAEAVVSGDSIAVTFAPDAEQWPEAQRQEDTDG